MVRPLIIALLATMFAARSPALARTWYVRVDGTGDTPTIQAAVDSAVAGDSIEVSPGTYFEVLQLGTKSLFVYGKEGAATTVIDGDGAGPVVSMGAGTLEGFSIRHGVCQCQGAGVSITGGTVTVRSCWIENNQAGLQPDAGRGGGVAVVIGATYVLLEGNTIRSNSAWDSGGGVAAYGGALDLVNNKIADNYAKNAGGGVWGSVVRAEGNLIVGNQATNIAAGVYLMSGNIRNNTIVENHLGWGAGYCNLVADSQFCNNIVAYNGSSFTPGSRQTYGLWAIRSFLQCTDLWGNERDEVYGTGNSGSTFSADPLFCDERNGEFHISSQSPCVDCEGLVGAFGVACTTGIEQTSWGAVKVMYR